MIFDSLTLKSMALVFYAIKENQAIPIVDFNISYQTRESVGLLIGSTSTHSLVGKV